MAEGSALQGAIEFLRDFGLFDIVLPFILVFTIIFAVLEKTRVLGTEGENHPKKNLNAMVAFVIGFLVISTNQVVNAINKALPNVVLLLVLSISFLILAGIFMQTGEMDLQKRHEKFYRLLILIMFVGVILIFLNSLEYQGNSWLVIGIGLAIQNIKGPVVSAGLLLGVVILAMWYITSNKDKDNKGDDE